MRRRKAAGTEEEEEQEQDSHLLVCPWSCLRRPKDFTTECTALGSSLETCTCVCPCVSASWMWSLPSWWTGHWSSQQAGSCTSGRVRRGGLPLASSLSPCQCLPPAVASHRIASADGRASNATSGIGAKRDAGRCPRLPEQRPNRGGLPAAASRRAGPHPAQNSEGARRWLPIRGPWPF